MSLCSAIRAWKGRPFVWFEPQLRPSFIIISIRLRVMVLVCWGSRVVIKVSRKESSYSQSLSRASGIIGVCTSIPRKTWPTDNARLCPPLLILSRCTPQFFFFFFSFYTSVCITRSILFTSDNRCSSRYRRSMWMKLAVFREGHYGTGLTSTMYRARTYYTACVRILAYCPESRTMKNQSRSSSCRTFKLSNVHYIHIYAFPRSHN